MSSLKPGIIIARSSDIISKLIGDKGADGDSLRPWNSLCTIPSQTSTASFSNKVHPFSGLLTSQLICTECEWKVKPFLKRIFYLFVNLNLLMNIIIIEPSAF